MRSTAKSLVAALLLSGGLSQAALAVEIGPTTVSVPVFGIPLDVPVRASLDSKSEAGTLLLDLALTGDLKALQDNALAIARKLPYPDDACARKGPNLVVNSIDSAAIHAQGETAVIDVTGKVTAWGCAKVLGQKIKTKIASDHIAITIPVELYTPTPQQLALRVKGEATIKTRDPQITEIANALVGDLNQHFTVAVAKALDENKARVSVPSIPGLDVKIEQAAFAQDQDRLLIKAKADGRATSAAFGALLGLAGQKAP
ncbi:hypothetical protein [Labrys neptuniae]